MSTAYTIVPATMADRPRIVAFLRTAFYKHEPLSVAQGFADSPSPADLQYTLDNLHEGHSRLAVDRDNRIVGATIAGHMAADEADHRRTIYEQCEDEGFKTFLKFWHYVERESNFWQAVQASRAFSLDILAVDPAARGMGIGRALVEDAQARAKKLGYEVFRMDCSSFFAAHLAELAGMTCVWQMAYEDYKDEKGEAVFRVDKPHLAIKLYMKRL